MLLWDLCELAMDGKQPVSARIQAAKALLAADLAAGNSPKRMQSILNIVSQVPANTKVEAASDGQNVAVRVERGAHEELLREGAAVGAIEAAGKPRGELKPSAQSQLMDRLMAAESSEDSA